MNSKDILKKLNKLLQNKENNIISNKNQQMLKFGAYNIIDRIGSGEQGTVLQVSNAIQKDFALKIYTPLEGEITQAKIERGLETFKKEIGITSKLNHKNIVKIISGGYAIWFESSNKWTIQEGFEGVSFDELKKGAVLFYIMDIIKGRSLDEVFMSLAEDKKESNFIDIDQRLYFFEKLIAQISLAIEYFNVEQVFHTDIKADNIRLSASDNNFIILDFGFARDIKSIKGFDVDEAYLEKQHLKHIKVYTDNESNNLQTPEDRYSKIDMFQFCSLMLDILDEFRAVYGENRYNGIKAILKKGCGPLEKRYSDLKALYNDLNHNFIIKTPWKLQYKLGEYMTAPKFGKFSTHIVLPEHTLALITKEMDKIIRTQDFQHLRGVKQLGPTIFVYPGANHTRFEHSLGAYHLAMRYLDKLVPQSEFRKFCDPIDETIKLTALSALLHDIGHYPYSHWIEEIKYKFSNGDILDSHEVRGCNIINNGKIGGIIQNIWNISVKSISMIIGNEQRPLKDSKENTIRSIIDSQIDVDKLDYLIRDSIHCGVSYGKSIDIEIFLSNLTVDRGTKKIGLTSKGRTTFNAIIDARNNMYEGVYWHKTVRSCEAMFKRFFYEYLTISAIEKEEVEELFKLDDTIFLHKLLSWVKDNPERKNLRKLIEPFALSSERELYKPAFIYFHNNNHGEEDNTTYFFRKLVDMNFTEIRNKSNRLAQVLRMEYNELREIDDSDILLETTPLQTYNKVTKLEDFRFWNPRKKRYDTTPDEINSNLKYLLENVQAYLFCNPKYRTILNTITKSKKFNEILSKL
ncbi:MAG: HD domain-containing protein [Candidatus Marinimicrobia bacterium]|nr:HD domain-containing protein [Candidatus Neomarinimicrobiota bacterium]